MSQPLTLSFRSDTTEARNAMAQLASSVVSNMLTIGNAMKTANDNISALPGLIRNAAVAFIAFEAVKLSLSAISQAAEAAREKLAEIVKVSQGAQTAGVGTNFFQQLQSQAEQLNTTTERLVEMLNRAREASTVNLGTGGNPNQSSIQNLLGQHRAAGNISQGDIDAFDAAGSQEERIRRILDLIERLNGEGRKLAALNIGANFFGKDFENQLRNGVDIIGRMRDALTQTKDVAFPPDVIARGVELNKQLDEAEKKMREGWLPIQQDILRWQQDELASLVTIKGIIGDIALAIGGWYTGIKNAGNAISDFINGLNVVKGFADWTKSLPTGIFGKMSGVEYLDDAGRQRLIDEQAKNASRPLPAITIDGDDISNPLPKLGGGRAAAAASADEVDTYIKNLQKAVEVLNAENRTYGLGNRAKAEAVDMEKALAAARSRGTDLTEDEIRRVKELADEEGKAKDKAEELRRATEGANARANFLGEQAISALERIGEKGTRAKDVILDFAKALEKAALQAALLGTGPLAQLFGTQGTGGNTGGIFGNLFGGSGIFGRLFGGGETPAAVQAEGGWAGSGPRAMVPTAVFRNAVSLANGGGIPAILHPGEIVLNQAQQKNVAQGLAGGSRINVTHAPVINGAGLSAEQLLAILDRNNKAFARQIGPTLNDWQRRHG